MLGILSNCYIDEPSRDPKHVDYIPTIFAFTTEEQRAALWKRVKKHEQVISMKKRRLEC